MDKINILSKDVINKIAAGEVIERPASVVKELIENSIDAGSEEIVVEIRDAGKSFIKVIDNGCGMSVNDAKKAILRHSTSKISSADELFKIKSLGFRGEALTSICAIANVKIITKSSDDDNAISLEVESSEIINESTVARNNGTTIEVTELFFNTPARKKYLKNDSTERSHITDIITRYSLLNEHISFTLISDGKEIINSPKTNDLLNKIVNIYGKDMAKNMLTIDYEDSFAKVKGFILKPYDAKRDQSLQTIFINDRYVKCQVVTNAIKESYSTLLFLDKIPAAVLYIRIDPEKTDVNVHPTKEIIRIEHEELLFKCVFDGIRNVLTKNNLIPEVDIEDNVSRKPSKLYEFKKDKQMILESGNSDDEKRVIKENKEYITHKIVDENEFTSRVPIGPFRILGQINRLYVICENPRGLLIVDQHAAEERVNFEKILDEMKNKNIIKQSLLRALKIELDARQAGIVLDNLELFKSVGFDIEDFGKNTIMIREIPKVIKRMNKELFFDMLSEMSRSPVDKLTVEQVARMACRASVKAGDSLTIPQIESILEELIKCDNPYTCPHGRPTLISIPIEEMEKKFKRVG